MTVAASNHGKVEALQQDGAMAFLGIPFAAPPIGPLRFHAPRPPQSWAGVRESKIGFASPQTTHPIPGFAASCPQDEDCLYLNVYTPALDGARRPVMFWIHGGGFTHGTGADALFEGAPLVRRGDVVVVTINYRLGALGFLSLESHLPGSGVSANNGILDCIAALEWTRDNIEGFGGDASNVTIFGESAGAAAVGTLLAMPGARGLFQRAILQSGTGRAATPARAAQVVDAMLETLGLERGNAAQLLSLPAAIIVEAQSKLTARLDRRDGPVFGPVSGVPTLPEQPRAAIAAGSAAGVPIIVGTNRDEVKLFASTTRREQPDEAGLLADVRDALPKADAHSAANLIATYRASRQAKLLPSENLDIIDAIRSDIGQRIPAMNLAIAQGSHAPGSFNYLFTHASPARHGALGSCHALELPFVWGTLHTPTQDRFAGAGPEVQRLSGEMMDAWIGFARSGSPAHEGIGPWAGYDAAARQTMIFGHPSAAEADPFGEERRATEALL